MNVSSLHTNTCAWSFLSILVIYPRAPSTRFLRGHIPGRKSAWPPSFTLSLALSKLSVLHKQGLHPTLGLTAVTILPFSSDLPPQEWHNLVRIDKTQSHSCESPFFWVRPSCFSYLMDFCVWTMQIISDSEEHVNSLYLWKENWGSSRWGLASQQYCLWRWTMCWLSAALQIAALIPIGRCYTPHRCSMFGLPGRNWSQLNDQEVGLILLVKTATFSL